MIYVTHDQVEAMTLADKIVVLNGGTVEQYGSPLELYHHPQNLFVAGFIGSPKMNFLDGEVQSIANNAVTVSLPSGEQVVADIEADSISPGDKVTLGLRPEHLVDGGKSVGQAERRRDQGQGDRSRTFGRRNLRLSRSWWRRALGAQDRWRSQDQRGRNHPRRHPLSGLLSLQQGRPGLRAPPTTRRRVDVDLALRAWDDRCWDASDLVVGLRP